MDIKELDLIDPSTYWYYQAKLLALKLSLEKWGFCGGNIVDVGAGSGFFSIALLEAHEQGHTWCIDPNYPRDQLGDRGVATFQTHASPDVVKAANTFLFVDVLEHVPDDTDLLSSYVREATPDALFAITVPAFMSLWSGHDVFLEHYRRYRRAEVVDLCRRSGLEILHSQYLFGSTFGPLWLMRRFGGSKGDRSDLKPIPRRLNRVLTSFMSAEHRLGWNPAFGSSVMLIGRKPT